MLARAGNTDPPHAPYLDEKRRKFLEDALAFYQGYQRDEDDDPAARRALARARGQVGRIQDLLGRRDAAEQSWIQAIVLQQSLVSQYPNDPKYRVDLAFSEHHLAMIKHATGPGDD